MRVSIFPQPTGKDNVCKAPVAAMRSSRFFIATQKEVPAEAEIASHRLMLRAGLIRRLSAGVYTWLPLGMRVLHKVARIVREEMNRAGAIEIAMPVV